MAGGSAAAGMRPDPWPVVVPPPDSARAWSREKAPNAAAPALGAPARRNARRDAAARSVMDDLQIGTRVVERSQGTPPGDVERGRVAASSRRLVGGEAAGGGRRRRCG